MFPRVFSVAASIALIGVVVGDRTDCRDVSSEVDEWLAQAGGDMRRSGGGSVPVAGFKRLIPVSVFGFDIPYLQVRLEVSNGSVQSLDKLARASDFIKCKSSSTTNVTSGQLQYDNASVDFTQMKAGFLFWETEGKFKYKFLPKLRLVFESDSKSKCYLQAPIILESSGDSDYAIDTGSSVKGWIIRKILHSALLGGGDNTPMLLDFVQLASQAIDSFFGPYCCQGMQT